MATAVSLFWDRAEVTQLKGFPLTNAVNLTRINPDNTGLYSLIKIRISEPLLIYKHT